MRQENWTFNGIPTAMLVSLGFIAVGVIALLWRHRPGHDQDAPATRWRHATWGALGAIPEGADVEDEDDDEFDDDDEYDDDDEFDDDDESTTTSTRRTSTPGTRLARRPTGRTSPNH